MIWDLVISNPSGAPSSQVIKPNKLWNAPQGLTWHLRFPRQESAGGTAAGSGVEAAGQPGRSCHGSRNWELDRWRFASLGKGHGLRNGDVASEHRGGMWI